MLRLDERVKAYAVVSSISEAFNIHQGGVAGQHRRGQAEAIKAQLTGLDSGTLYVIDI